MEAATDIKKENLAIERKLARGSAAEDSPDLEPDLAERKRSALASYLKIAVPWLLFIVILCVIAYFIISSSVATWYLISTWIKWYLMINKCYLPWMLIMLMSRCRRSLSSLLDMGLDNDILWFITCLKRNLTSKLFVVQLLSGAVTLDPGPWTHALRRFCILHFEISKYLDYKHSMHLTFVELLKSKVSKIAEHHRIRDHITDHRLFSIHCWFINN